MTPEQKQALEDAARMMCPYCAQDFPFKDPWYHTGFPDNVMRMCSAHEIHDLVAGRFAMPRNLKQTDDTGLIAAAVFERYHKDTTGVPRHIQNAKARAVASPKATENAEAKGDD